MLSSLSWTRVEAANRDATRTVRRLSRVWLGKGPVEDEQVMRGDEAFAGVWSGNFVRGWSWEDEEEVEEETEAESGGGGRGGGFGIAAQGYELVRV